jgi:hypothetical protein
MADKPKCPWVEARTADEKKAAVIANPELRHVYAQALSIYNGLTETEKESGKLQPELNQES